MPKFSGREVLSEQTEKAQARLLLVGVIAIVSKAYRLPVGDIRMLGMEFPASVFDVSMLALVLWHGYTYLVRWSGDLLTFRLWFSESSVWSELGTHLKLDRKFLSGGIAALIAFNNYEQARLQPNGFAALPPEERKLYEDFRLNAGLFASRLYHVGRKFKTISAFGRFYVWVQGFAFPIGVAALAVYLLIKYGSFSLPLQL